MKTVIITRKYWGTGMLRRHVTNNLPADMKPRPTDTKCCLGFVCEAYGISPERTLNRCYPKGATNHDEKVLPDWLLDHSYGSDTMEASKINDAVYLSLEQKEERLKLIFLKHGIRLVFRGKR